MSLITPFPEAESPALERFALHGRGPVASLLGELRDRQALVTLYYGEGTGFTVGNVISVDGEREEIVIECSGDARVQESMAQASRIVAVGFLDGAKIQFDLGGAAAAQGQCGAAVRLPLPARALRIQRRGAPRRHPPGGRPALCRIPAIASSAQPEALRVLDLSNGGLGLVAAADLPELTRDRVVAPCYLDLPEVGQVVVVLRVRYVEAWPGEVGGRRCGCEFVDLAGGARRAIQLYLNRLEESRRANGDLRAA